MAEEKVIVFDPLYCSGCMYCMTACSTYHQGSTSLSKSRIHIVRHEGHAIANMMEEDHLIFDLITCQQCDQPYCQYLCPALAIEKDPMTGALKVNHDRCIGCRMCMVGCPFGAILYDSNRKQVLKCELCGGEPQCVRFCISGALKFLPKDLSHLVQRDRFGREKIRHHFKKVEGESR